MVAVNAVAVTVLSPLPAGETAGTDATADTADAATVAPAAIVGAGSDVVEATADGTGSCCLNAATIEMYSSLVVVFAAAVPVATPDTAFVVR